ncbi:MAG: hypothetical protein WKF78_04460 [Candidatus Limnocylindrales bacterium]
MILRNGIEVGNIFKLGTKYSDAAGATYLGEDGQAHPIVMGSYGIGVGRNTACIVEAHHDAKGIIWPVEVAPYAAHLVSIGAAREPRVTEVAERLHSLAAEAGSRREILWDDRRRVAGSQVHRRGIAGHALDPDRVAALAGRRRHRGDGTRDRRSIHPPDHRGRGLPRERRHAGTRRGRDSERLIRLGACR